MSQENRDKTTYDVVSVSRTGTEKKANYVKDAYHIEKQERSSGQFVKVFADIFLKHEAGKRSYF